MKKYLNILMLTASLAMAGCGAKWELDDKSRMTEIQIKVRPGMSEDEVKKAVGSPTTTIGGVWNYWFEKEQCGMSVFFDGSGHVSERPSEYCA